MRALVTGGAGFIGLHLARRLLDGNASVDLLENFSRGVQDEDLAAVLGRPGARLLRADLLQPGALDALDDRYDSIFHLAALVGVANVARRPFEVLRDNPAMLTAVLSLAARQKTLGRLVFASTSEVYAGTLEAGTLPVPTPEDVVLTLPDLRRPRTSYLLSKIHGEALCLHSGLPVTIVRPHNVYGPRMGLSHVIPELMKRAWELPEGGTLTVFSADHRRTFCYVEDAVEILTRAAAEPACAGEVLNVGSAGPEVRIGDLAGSVCRTVGRTARIVPGPETPGSPVRRCPDMSKTLRLTQVHARVGLDEGLERTWRWYRDRVFEGGAASAV